MKIVVLAGGISTERDVSLVTGSMIYKALVNKGHEVVLLDVYLGYEEDNPYNRKAIGDFACYLAFVNGINAR